LNERRCQPDTWNNVVRLSNVQRRSAFRSRRARVIRVLSAPAKYAEALAFDAPPSGDAANARWGVYGEWSATGRIGAGVVERLRARASPARHCWPPLARCWWQTVNRRWARPTKPKNDSFGALPLDGYAVSAAVALARHGRCWSAVVALQTFYEPTIFGQTVTGRSSTRAVSRAPVGS
jgi:hypothetical protein